MFVYIWQWISAVCLQLKFSCLFTIVKQLFVYFISCLFTIKIAKKNLPIFWTKYRLMSQCDSPSHGSQILQWILDFNCTFNAWLLLLSSALKRAEKTSFQSFEWCNRGLSRGLRFFSDSSFFPTKKFKRGHGVWKSQKSLIQHCERSELRLHFEWTKVN